MMIRVVPQLILQTHILNYSAISRGAMQCLDNILPVQLWLYALAYCDMRVNVVLF